MSVNRQVGERLRAGRPVTASLPSSEMPARHETGAIVQRNCRLPVSSTRHGSPWLQTAVGMAMPRASIGLHDFQAERCLCLTS